MIDTSHTFHSSTPLTSDQIGLAILYINENGPDLLDYQIGSDLAPLDIEDIRRFAVYTMMSSTQGAHYAEDIVQLPVSWKPGYQAIVCSLLASGADQVHYRYYQLVLFVPDEFVMYLPNILQLKTAFIDLFKELSHESIGNLSDDLLSLINYFHFKVQ